LGVVEESKVTLVRLPLTTKSFRAGRCRLVRVGSKVYRNATLLK
jgi:hypothetical protein